MSTSDHFKGKDAIEHVAEAQAQGIISSSEIHGTEIPGPISAGADACRDTAMLFILLFLLLEHLHYANFLIPLSVFLGCWGLWRMGRAAWLGWSRLERLHRVLLQEKWEIEHNRNQERDELKELYRSKGFEGKLLEDVVDVLMADGDRLLKVMVEEELGLSLERMDHPLKQGIGAGAGAFLTGALILVAATLGGSIPALLTTLFLIGAGAGLLAFFARNQLIPAITWNVSLAILCGGFLYYFLKLL